MNEHRLLQDTWKILDREAAGHMKSYEVEVVPGGTHHTHMNDPEKILPKLTKFLFNS